MKTICVKCGKEFNVPPGTIKHGNGKFCSINCYRIEQRGGIETMRKCLRCEKAYNVSPSRIKTGRGKYCSRSCQNKAAFKKCVCRFCGKKYLNYISQGGDKYCSLICYKKSKPAFEIKNCLYCRKEIIAYSFHIKANRKKYCSRKCCDLSKRKSEEHKKNRQRKYLKKYRKENHDWYVAIKHKRRALNNNALGHFTKNDWREIKTEHQNKCAICKEEKKLTVDHIIPLSMGGTNFKNNIQPLCGSCNSRKFNKILK